MNKGVPISHQTIKGMCILAAVYRRANYSVTRNFSLWRSSYLFKGFLW